MGANSVFEFLKQNYCQTTTQFVVNSNTSTVENIINPERNVQYYSEDFDSDSTTATMRISFDETTAVSRIALLEHNLKNYRIYYNGTTANTFSLTSTGSTVTSAFSSNSETSQYFRSATVNCTSVSIDMYSTQVANAEKAIGHLIISDTHLQFTKQPNASSYTPLIDPEQVVHTMSDGGVRVHTVKRKHSAQVKLKNISTAFRNSLRTIHELTDPFVFCPFGTTTAWDEIIFECVWPGNFDFHKYSDDAQSSGFSGTITLRETS